MHRRTAWQFLAFDITVCAVDHAPLRLLDPRPLITPEPGKAVLYLLRIPRESFELVVNVDGVRTALLSMETCAAIASVPSKSLLSTSFVPIFAPTQIRTGRGGGWRRASSTRRERNR